MSDSKPESKNTQEEVHEYQAEMKQVLQILIHSLYTEREIFIRELVSNASDALSKVQFAALTDENIVDAGAELQVKISYDEEAKTITIEDNGIGMNKEEIVQNLGTIASSGTLKFLEECQKSEKQPENLIGQFGVGFYSVFMAAKKVVLQTRSYRADDTGWQWISEGNEQYSLSEVEKASRGTKIEVHLKEDAHEFCNQFRIESIIKKYSNYVPFPVVVGDKTINQVKAIWTQSKDEVKAEEYEEFYKQLSHDFRPALHRLHLSIDAPIQYYGLLFFPQEVSNEVLYARESKGMHLYAQRVFIQEDNKHLLPAYLRFIHGVVDSEDLPLNVSRETVQHSALIEKIKKSLTSRVLRELKNLSESNVETYQKIWKQYGLLMKEGVSSDFANKEKIIDLLRFNTSLCEDAEATASLKDYVGRMREDQNEIYYAIGSSRDALLHHPNYEYFKTNHIEVVLLTDHIDDFLVADLREYDGKTLKNISQADVSAEAQADQEKLPEEEAKALVAFLKEKLGERVADVVESKRLIGSPCSLVGTEEGMSSQMERMMKMVNKEFQVTKRNLEINTGHPIIQNLAKILHKDKDSAFLNDAVEQLFKNVLLVEGLLENPVEILPNIYQLMEDASKYHLNS